MKIHRILLKLALWFAALLIVPIWILYYLKMAVDAWTLNLPWSDAIMRCAAAMTLIIVLGALEATCFFLLKEIRDDPDSW